MFAPPKGSVRWSAHAMRSLSGVAGESIWNQPSMPASFLASYTASFRAKNTEAPRKNGGSPIALDEYTMGRRWLGESLRRVTQKFRGMSLADGILYVPADHDATHTHATCLCRLGTRLINRALRHSGTASAEVHAPCTDRVRSLSRQWQFVDKTGSG